VGKPFISELQILPETYKWALDVGIESLIKAVSDSFSFPLICIGSGGSFTAAHFISQLHERYFHQISKPVTPLEFIDTENARGKAVIILSAGGRNPDIIGALKNAIEQEAARIIVVCFQKGSRLSSLAKKHRHVDLIEYDIPSGKDGFLATNSLLAFNLLLLRAYLTNVRDYTPLPRSLNNLLEVKGDLSDNVNGMESECGPLWQRKTLIVLYGTSGASAGIDIESKFTEAALHTTQIADYRNFAHGRHHWLAKHAGTSAVLALITEDDRALAKKTLGLLPKQIPVVEIETSFSGTIANLSLLVAGFYITNFVGKTIGIDPGRPGVPPFGSKIYRLNAFGNLRPKKPKLDSSEEVAICRKTGFTLDRLRLNGSLDYWQKAYEQFVKNLRTRYFRAIVFDYDGTLCDEHDRFTGISDEVTKNLIKLLRSGITIGIATGRGKSVREVLQDKLPTDTWPSVLIGYYNCADISNLADNSSPNASPAACPELKDIADAIQNDYLLESLSDIAVRPKQITLEPASKLTLDFVWNHLEQKVNSMEPHNYRVVRSSHSFDVIPKDVSKSDLVNLVRKQLPNSSILCIGDKGKFPGNDFELLTEEYSLSVDETSIDPTTCWNLAPVGIRGVQATEKYLSLLGYTKTGIRFRI
jgi:hypothetical protein